jgi:hypothetical protein
MARIDVRNFARLPADADPLIFAGRRGRLACMKAFLALLTLAVCTAHAAAAERVVLYARILENLNAELTDGSVWQIDKGDCFPVVAYKDSHTKLVLRLASTQFMVLEKSAVIVSEKETPAAIENYRISLNSYINGVSMRWRAKAEAAGTK